MSRLHDHHDPKEVMTFNTFRDLANTDDDRFEGVTQIDVKNQDRSELEENDNNNYTPLNRAARLGNVWAFTFLKDYGAKTSTTDILGNNPLINALLSKSKTMINNILNDESLDFLVLMENKDGYRAINYAQAMPEIKDQLQSKQIDLVKKLVLKVKESIASQQDKGSQRAQLFINCQRTVEKVVSDNLPDATYTKTITSLTITAKRYITLLENKQGDRKRQRSEEGKVM